jgi:hypothetical protein
MKKCGSLHSHFRVRDPASFCFCFNLAVKKGLACISCAKNAENPQGKRLLSLFDKIKDQCNNSVGMGKEQLPGLTKGLVRGLLNPLPGCKWERHGLNRRD